MRPPLPRDESGRLAALRSLDVLDTGPEAVFDELVALASRVCGTPISLVSLIDEHRQWFKARLGLEATETPRELAFCAHVIAQDALFEVPDARQDERFSANPLVVGEPGIRFYASVPLTTAGGHNVGTLCVLDHAPRVLTPGQRVMLESLGRAVTAQLELRRALAHAAELTQERERAEREQRQTAELLAAVTSISSGALANLDLRTAFERILAVLLQVTGSEFGFIGEILTGPDGGPVLRTQALSDVAWNDETRRLYDEHTATGMEFSKLTTLFGAVMTSGEPAIANDPSSDPRRGGLPPGHPPLRSFLGVPFVTGAEVSGMIGLANAPGGYDDGAVRRIEPILAVLGSFVASIRHERERRSAEDAMRLSERRFRQTLAAAQAGAWEWDFVRARGFWSEEDYRLLGYEPGTVEPSLEALLRRIHPEDRDGARSAIERAVAAGSPFEYDYRVVRPDGTVRWLRDVGDVETDEAGNPTRVSGIVTDITERKNVERQVLEQRNQLSAANAELERSARLKDEFLAAMSHELRTPLNAVLGLSEGLRAGVFGALTEKQGLQVAIIEDSGRHLLQLINDILDLSKIGAGKLELAVGPVDVESICLASLRMVREAALRKRIRLATRFDPGLRLVAGDPLRLRQILVNLLSNAVKFTPEGGSVEVETRGDADAERACLTVADTGIGIAAEDLPRLFQPFVQLDGGLAREHSGTGLGLSLVQRLAELHGGGVSLETEPGRGSRFTVALPWRPEEPEVPPESPAGVPPTPAPVGSAIAPARGGGVERPLLLIADDHELNVHVLGSYLSALGYRLAIARNGLEAVARTLSEKPDLVLMDLQMPGLDGFEATRRIRASAEVGRVPVIALSALAMPGDRERSLAAGADDYLAKPVKLALVAELVERRLAGER